MFEKVFDTVASFFSKLSCSVKCCANEVKVSSPKSRRLSKPKSPLRRQRTI